MRSIHLQALTTRDRVLRSLVIIILLLGGLLPEFMGLNVVVAAAVVAAPLVVYDLWRALPRVHEVIYIVVPVFGIFAAHAIFVAPGADYGVEKLLKFVTLTLATAMSACLLRDEESVSIFAKTWVLYSSLLSVMALFEYSGSGRAGGFDSSPIWLARALVAAALMVLWFWRTRVYSRWACIPVIVLLLAGAFVTGSRGPVLGFAVGCVVLAFLGRSGRGFRLLLLFGVAAVGVAMMRLLPIFSQSRLTNPDSASASNYYRRLLWEITPPVVVEHPLGVGFGNWASAAGAPEQYSYPHSLFLEIASELGIPITIAFVCLIAYVLISLYRISELSRASMLIVVLLCSELVAVNLSGDLNARTFFFLLTLGFLVSRWYRKGKKGLGRGEHAAAVEP
ncbi:O-antigen ligase family protein [Sanguibacter inulinus]|uniref:O-antigen ligase family protein n=1 Tax=Sanguibacter inulinus TaxID=60922 RepID=A0A853EW98_9MICO|nr:O-antigen ligase family protein [Sanguibacter inulinus]MBF0722787.1 O-antigen ligase family protein [Sanguibacter inulinus]NYS93932.1 O-antigen ligase family protein [Sanguibacter inulinus]